MATLVQEAARLVQALGLLTLGMYASSPYKRRVLRIEDRARRRLARRRAHAGGVMAEYICPECDTPLELYANGDNGPQDDRWSCDRCGIEYPHTQFPLPPGYVAQARQWERERAEQQRREHDQLALDAWNRWAERRP